MFPVLWVDLQHNISIMMMRHNMPHHHRLCPNVRPNPNIQPYIVVKAFFWGGRETNMAQASLLTIQIVVIICPSGQLTESL